LFKRKIFIKFLIAALKTFTNSKNCSGSRILHNFCIGFPPCHWPIFSGVHPSWDAVKILIIEHVLDGFRYAISDLRGFLYVFPWSKIAASEHLKGVSGRFFIISK
jgi:hypothetical protein